MQRIVSILAVGSAGGLAALVYLLLALHVAALLIAAAGLGVLLGYTFAHNMQIKKIYRSTFATTKGHLLCEPLWLRLTPAPAVVLSLIILVVGLEILLEFNTQSWYGLAVFVLFGGSYALGQASAPKQTAYYYRLMTSTLHARHDPASKTLLRSLEAHAQSHELSQ
jgi:hypothetical protein